MSVKIYISCKVKGYHLRPFQVKEGEVFSRGEHGNAFEVFDGMGQLGHLQAELVSPLWPHNTNISAKVKLPVEIDKCNLHLNVLIPPGIPISENH